MIMVFSLLKVTLGRAQNPFRLIRCQGHPAGSSLSSMWSNPNNPMKLSKDLREFVELLNSRKIRYVLVGGHAVAYHGFPRFTGDVDFFHLTLRPKMPRWWRRR